MPVSVPPPIALREFLGSTTRHIRRVEIYEQDGITRWAKDTTPRLKSGNVTVDYSRDERRALDLVLSNSDGGLVNAAGEFWYDKIIKVFRGVEVRERPRLPKIIILTDDPQGDTAIAFRVAMVKLGFGDIQINPLASSLSDLTGYDIVVNVAPESAVKRALTKAAYDEGYRVATFDGGTVANYGTDLFGIDAADTVLPLDDELSIKPRVSSHPLGQGWVEFFYTFFTTPEDIPTVSVSSVTSPYYASITEDTAAVLSAFQQDDRRWAMYHLPTPNEIYEEPQFLNMLTTVFNWLDPVVTLKTWEVQIGEFMIDRISEPNFPHDVKITGRDYTKKCLLSKYTHATQFTSGISLESLIGAIAGSAGISKRSLPATGIVVGRTFFFERGVSRWDAMKEIATAYNHEIYFDAAGYLVIRPFRDPAQSSPVIYIETGRQGQVASYEKSTADARIYNHIVVTGESSDANTIPVYAEAINDDPNSPTCIQEIGDRLYQYTSSFITTVEQAQAVADSFLAVHALEEFELTFESLLLPWLEAGDILGWIDPNPAPNDPTTFLLSSLSLPLTLAPMGGVGKRVTNVGVV